MGTNYYGCVKNQFPQSFTVNSHDELEALIETLSELSTQTRIHLGKKSFGWKFLGQWNGGKYYQTREQFEVFVQTLQIKNEYGNDITFEEFKDLLDIQGRSHYEEVQSGEINIGHRFCYQIDGLDFADYEFS